ncbi:LOW QUALITY PROTEIN: A-kinase anchor protein 12-like [Pterocles gutturalis]
MTVEQTGHSSVTLKEDSKTIEPCLSDSNTKDSVNAAKEDAHTVKRLPSSEEDAEDLDHASEPQSSILGFRKVFKFVRFRFTVEKEKMGKSKQVRLLTVKKATQVLEGADDQKVSLEEIAMPEDALSAEDNTEDTLKNEKSKDESPQTPEANEICSQSAAKANDTVLPLRFFFTRGWTIFRKRKSFTKWKEDGLQSSTKEEEQEKERATLTTETSGKEEKPEFEQPDKEKNVTAVTIEAHEREQTEGEKPESEKTVAAIGVEACEKEELIKHDEQGQKEDVAAAVVKESKEHETELPQGDPGSKSFSTSERSVETEDDQQSIKPTDKGLQGKTGMAMTDTIKADEITTEITPDEAAGKRPPEGITNEAELLSLQEKTELRGSPLKKLFAGTGLKKLPGKKHKGKREESKLGAQGEPIQHLSGSPDSPEEQKGESSPSSPEEFNEISSLEKSGDGVQVAENEDAAISDVERKREGVTPWASFKNMVTPKKRVRKPSESDKEEEIDKTKAAAVSAIENAVDENQGELESGMDRKAEKAPEEPKRNVDTSVSWEAFICVRSSKKRARKSSSSDEETEHKLGQENQKVEESGQSKEMATDAILTSSQESAQGQGNSSPEQAGSPSKGEGISTWESFKRLVTPRRKSKTKTEERTEDSVVGCSLEHSTSDGEPGKDESWVSFRKLMPRHRKKKSDGKQEPTHLKQARKDVADIPEDSDIPAVFPLSEHKAAEREKIEAQEVKDAEATRAQTSEEERTEKLEETLRIEQAHERTVCAVIVTVVEGERVLTSIEERSLSWTSAARIECIEEAKEGEEKEMEKTLESDVIVEEAEVAERVK